MENIQLQHNEGNEFFAAALEGIILQLNNSVVFRCREVVEHDSSGAHSWPFPWFRLPSGGVIYVAEASSPANRNNTRQAFGRDKGKTEDDTLFN